MKKWLILLLIPLFFGCGDDESSPKKDPCDSCNTAYQQCNAAGDACEMKAGMCLTNNDCSDNSEGKVECDTAQKTCIEPANRGTEGNFCRFADPKCDTGLTCNTSNICEKEVVEEKGTEGKTCRDTDPKCDTGLTCNASNICEKEVVEEKGTEGKACRDTDPKCDTGLTCNASNICEKEVVEEKGTEGKSCRDTDPKCNEGLTCNASNICEIPAGDDPVIQIAAGGKHSCALTQKGRVFCWGYNFDGQLGVDKNFEDYTNCDTEENAACNATEAPTELTFNLTDLTVTSLAMGDNYSCVMISDGTGMCWGDNSNGKMGTGGGHTKKPEEFIVKNIALESLTEIASINPSMEHTCFLMDDGRGRCVGSGEKGALANGKAAEMAGADQEIQELIYHIDSEESRRGLEGMTQITTGAFHTCAVMDDKTVMCWGDNQIGQIGINKDYLDYDFDGETAFAEVYPRTVLNLAGVKQISAGKWHTCALLEDGTVKCWGDNEDRELGDGSTVAYQKVPVAVAGLTDVKMIHAGNNFSCALLNDNSVKCWGNNSSNQIDDSTTSKIKTPTAVPGFVSIKQLSTGHNHLCGLTTNGVMKCRGDNSKKQLGTSDDVSENIITFE